MAREGGGGGEAMKRYADFREIVFDRSERDCVDASKVG